MVLLALAACTSSESDNPVPMGESNPATLWFAMNRTTSTMQLVGEEPRPY